MQTIYLDISNKGVMPTIYAKQGDVGRKFMCIISDSGLPYAIPEGATVSVFYQNLKDTNAGNASEVGVIGNSVEVILASAITSVSGDGILCLTISYKNGDEISTWNIPYSVDPKPGVQPIDPESPIWKQKAVLYTKQNLTASQKEQARKNIDAVKTPTRIVKELFFFGEHDDFQTYGNQRIYKIAGQQVWLNSPADFDFRVRFNITRNVGQVEEYEFTKSDCTISETVQGRKHWRFFANVSGTPSLVLTVANGIDPGSFESEPYCSFIYPSDLENYSVEFFKLSETEQEVNVVTSVNGIEADEYGNVQIDVGGGSGGGADGFSPVAKVTQTDTGAVISITDKKGTTTATVANGKDGASGVYVGSGEMPEGYNVQIDPDGETDVIPTKLPNPNALKFTGAVQAEYDGSSPTTVNIPSGSSGGVSSWNDLTDKPFYTEMGNGVILPETAAIFVEDQGVFAIADPVALVIGEEYSVSWNGVPYSCVALPYEEEGVLMGAMLGNVGAMTGESMTEEPFLVICVTPEMMEVTGSPVGIMIMPLDGSESVTLSISGLMEIVHPIDKKYLPKAAIPANGKVVFAKDDAGNYICNKTYEEIGMMFESGIFPWAQLNGVTNDGYPLFLKDFQVTSIGIQFSTTAYFQLANTGDNAVMGAFYVFVIVAESGEISCSVFRLDAKDVTP